MKTVLCDGFDLEQNCLKCASVRSGIIRTWRARQHVLLIEDQRGNTGLCFPWPPEAAPHLPPHLFLWKAPCFSKDFLLFFLLSSGVRSCMSKIVHLTWRTRSLRLSLFNLHKHTHKLVVCWPPCYSGTPTTPRSLFMPISLHVSPFLMPRRFQYLKLTPSNFWISTFLRDHNLWFQIKLTQWFSFLKGFSKFYNKYILTEW